jgi:hypothetical protein
MFSLTGATAQVYTTSGGELIFQSAFVEKNGDDLNTAVRFSAALHLGEFVHADLGNNIGFFSGIGLRNVGFITNQNDIRIKYRTYNLGIPLAFKIGSFKKNFYFFGGGEYEWMIHFKQKTFRDEGKFKYSSWFSSRTAAFIPSVFGGFQFPGGVQVKVRYYLRDFLNNKFLRNDEFNDYTAFSRTQIWYISFSYVVKNSRKFKTEKTTGEFAAL